MGSWGYGLYQDDIADDVRTYYKDNLKRGKTGEQITQELISEYQDVMRDEDDASVFWFALADTQWNMGRLEDFVKEKALFYITAGVNVERWNAEWPKGAQKRELVIRALREKLLSPQPEEKKVSQYKIYRCEWSLGDVFAYRFESEIAKESGLCGKYIYFVKQREARWHPDHIIPVVYFYKVVSDKLLTLEELVQFEFIPQFYKPSVYESNPNRQIEYSLALLNTSSRVIPKKQLVYIGRVANLPESDGKEHPYASSWKRFDQYIIDNFRNWGVLRKNGAVKGNI